MVLLRIHLSSLRRHDVAPLHIHGPPVAEQALFVRDFRSPHKTRAGRSFSNVRGDTSPHYYCLTIFCTTYMYIQLRSRCSCDQTCGPKLWPPTCQPAPEHLQQLAKCTSGDVGIEGHARSGGKGVFCPHLFNQTHENTYSGVTVEKADHPYM